MKQHVNRLVIGAVLYVFICLLANLLLKPFSFINFLGPAAGLAGALTIVWGRVGLVSALLGNISFILLQLFYFNYALDVAVILLSSLAIFLQAYWVQQLTEESVKKQRWLNNRRALFKFIFAIGPLVGVVSGLTALLVAILDLEQLQNPPLYIFATSYSTSILVSVFSIPAFLFTFGRQKLSLSKRFFLIVTSALGALAVSFLFYVSQNHQQYPRYHNFKQSSEAIALSVASELAKINDQLNALSALYKSSEQVSLREFRAFSHHLYQENTSVALLQWAPAVSAQNKQNFEKNTASELKVDYQITQQTGLGNIVLSANQNVYLPVKYIYPVNQYEKIYGLNLWQDNQQKQAMHRSVSQRKTVASEPFNLMLTREPEEAMFLYTPIYNIRNADGTLKLPKQSPVSGFIVAMVKMDLFFSELAKQFSQVNIHVEDVSHQNGSTIFGDVLAPKNRLQHKFHSDVFSRNWKISITEKYPWSIQDKSWQIWGMIAGATIGGILFQVLFLLLAVYSIELHYRVTLKTRELILVKEQSEKENHAKTQFLHTLSNELRTPFNVIKRLTETFPKESSSSKTNDYVANISDASLNLEQLIDTVNELSNIESGLVHLNHRPFDFSVFLSRMKNMIEVSPYLHNQEVKVVLSKDLPTFINTDELRLQKLFMMLVENVEEVLSSRVFCLSVNVHFHKNNNATLFFVVTHLDENMESSTIKQTDLLKGDTNFSALNTRMAMLQELCVLFGGDLKLSPLPSGNLMISASAKVNLHQLRSDKAALSTPELEGFNLQSLSQKRILLVQEVDSHEEQRCQDILKEEYHIEIVAEGDDILSYLEVGTYHFILFDCEHCNDNTLKTIRRIRQLIEYKNLPLIGFIPTDIAPDKVILMQGHMTEYAFKPISEKKLRQLLDKY